MSYDIERGKRVLTIPKDSDKRFNCWDHNVYLWCSACSNVHPQRFAWSVVAVGSSSEWGGEIMLPLKMWEMAHYADGGGIKPNNRDVSGVAYIKAWKEAAKQAKSVFDADGQPLWRPQVNLFLGLNNYPEIDAMADQGIEAFKPAYNRAEIFETFKRLFPEKLRGSWESSYVVTRENLLDAVFLWQHREYLPFACSLENSEREEILRSAA